MRVFIIFIARAYEMAIWTLIDIEEKPELKLLIETTLECIVF